MILLYCLRFPHDCVLWGCSTEIRRILASWVYIPSLDTTGPRYGTCACITDPCIVRSAMTEGAAVGRYTRGYIHIQYTRENTELGDSAALQLQVLEVKPGSKTPVPLPATGIT